MVLDTSRVPLICSGLVACLLTLAFPFNRISDSQYLLGRSCDRDLDKTHGEDY